MVLFHKYHTLDFSPGYFLLILIITCFNLTSSVSQPFGPQNLLSSGQSGPPQDLAVADIDNDGLPDVLVSGTPGIVWYRNLGGSNFAFQETLMPDFPGIEFEPGDFNGDGMEDIVFALDGDEDIIVSFWPHDRSCWYENDGITLFENTGDGVFTSGVMIHDEIGITDIVSCDLNDDGFQDILLASYSDIQWYKNLGNGQFSPRIMIHYFAWYGISVCAGDLDNNGTVDLVYSSPDYNYIACRYNDGLSNFGEDHYIYPASLNPGSVKTADIDLDGFIDIVATLEDNYTAKLVWYENLGNNNWSEEKVIAEGDYRYGPYMVDLDSDGDTDILSTAIISMASSRIIWCENIGGGAFKEPEIISEDVIWASGVFASDIDADG